MNERPHVVERVIARCRLWTKRVRDVTDAEGIFVFGSIINRDGRHFIPERSDVDLVAVIPRQLRCAPSRAHWLTKLQIEKRNLEKSLIPLLGRPESASPVVSLLPVTTFELRRDIHKSKVRDFFRKNLFMDLSGKTNTAPLLRRAPTPVDDHTREVLEFVQGMRNRFLGISAAGKQSLVNWNDSIDALPKNIMRYAAIASDAGTVLQDGLENIAQFIYLQKSFHSSYSKLYDWLSVRRGARGSKLPLEPENYLLFVEAILDMLRARKRTFPTKQTSRKGKKKRGTGDKDDIGELTHINGYKLFYFRANHKLSLARLARTTRLKPTLLRRLERITPRKGNLKPSLWFAACERDTLKLLENALDAHGRLEAGKPDDFLTQYMMFYDAHKRLKSLDVTSNEPEFVFQTRAIVFDFDGTLTEPADFTTTWEKIWVALGYPKEMCFALHRRYQKEEFTHETWCELTLEKFKAAKLRREQVLKIADDIALVDGLPETLTTLRNLGIKLFILSGSIKLIIRHVLGKLYESFEEIKANELLFDESGNIAKIEGTPYDFKGKAVFIKRVIEDYGLSPSDVLFVGNDCNDMFASQSGARTLCVNARLTDPANEEHWTYAIGQLANLRQILEYVRL